jgi:flagellin
MIINTNPGASMAARILGESSSALQKSLSRLSSGSKIASPSDDAAGTAVAMKFTAQINRTQAARDNVGNAIAFSQTQDGFLDKIGSALDRMSELAMLAQDETKTNQDRTLYEKEFDKLDNYIASMRGKNFNGVSLFNAASSLTVTVGADGTSTSIAAVNLAGSGDFIGTLNAAYTSVANTASAAAALTHVTNAISMLAQHRADVGANMSRLEAESSTLSVLKDNLSSARSRIADVDVAQESANFARQQILVQSGTAMLAQANVLPQSALRLIG